MTFTRQWTGSWRRKGGSRGTRPEAPEGRRDSNVRPLIFVGGRGKVRAGGFRLLRDGKRGRKQIEYGLMTNLEGRPVGIDVFRGNSSDAESLKAAISKAHSDFRLKDIVFVGNRGMITKTRIAELRELEGAGWVTALKAPDIASLAADGRPLQISLFDEQDFAEITHPDYPGERLVCCRNPALAVSRALKREDLLVATEADLAKISKSVESGRLKDRDKIGVRTGKVIGKHSCGLRPFAAGGRGRRTEPGDHRAWVVFRDRAWPSGRAHREQDLSRVAPVAVHHW
jgi:hypothetical protein